MHWQRPTTFGPSNSSDRHSQLAPEASSGDDIASTVIERAKRPSITTKLYPDNVAGVSIPVFKMHYDASKDTAAQTLGVACGGAVINSARETYRKALLSFSEK